MDFKITEITKPESRIYIHFQNEEGFNDNIVLSGEEFTSFSTGDKGHFLNSIESLKRDYGERDYGEIFHNLSEYIAALSEPGSCSQHDADEVKEIIQEMEGITSLIAHNQIALAAMDGKFSA